MAFRADGSAYRLKGRILRHLDNQPVTDADKSNMRDTLGITGTSGDLISSNNLSDVASKDTSKLNLEIPDIGLQANEVPLSGMLGDLAFQSSAGPSVGALEAESTTIKSDSGLTTTQALAVTNGTATRLAVLEDGRVGVGTESVTTGFNLEVVSGDMRVGDAAGADACELGYSAGAGKSFVQSYNRNTSSFSDLVLNNVATVTANGRLIIANIPTSASGLASGTVWSDSGTLKIVS